MIRFGVLGLQLTELFVSSVLHLLYGFYIFSSAVAGDLCQAFRECLFKPRPNLDENRDATAATNVENLPPIVLVHGIFGFGKGVCMRW